MPGHRLQGRGRQGAHLGPRVRRRRPPPGAAAARPALGPRSAVTHRARSPKRRIRFGFGICLPRTSGKGGGWMIELDNVSKHYGNKVAVHPLTLRIETGELFAFLGPNGAGKTTTIKMMCGLLFPTT